VTERPGEPTLVRAIGPWALGANAVNLTVGAGIFALPAVVATILGPAAVLAYVLCGVLILLVLACFAEVGSQVTRSGGAVAYLDEAFGPFAGFLAWVFFTLGFCIGSSAAIAHVMLDAVALSVPALASGTVRIAGLFALFAGLAGVNILGVRLAARFSIATTIAKLAPLLLLVVAGALATSSANLAWTGWPSGSQLGSAALVLFFAFAGAEGALTPSGEIRDPGRTVPRGMLGAAVAIVGLYVALQLTAQGVLGDELSRTGDAPLPVMAERVGGMALRNVIVACTALAVFGGLFADMLGAPRAFLVAADRGMLPAFFGRIHPRFRTPWVAITAYAGLSFALAVSGGFRALAVLSSMALLLIYLGVCLAALKLRYSRPRPPGTFRTPGGPTVALIASATVIWVLSHSTRREVLAFVAVAVVASLYYAIRRRFAVAVPRPAQPPILP
jgi:amino acid transporter